MSGADKVFSINAVCFDSANKEVVRISNGIDADGALIPTEAMALRVVGVTKTGDPVIAFTYRKVNPDTLSVLEYGSGMIDLHAVRPSRFIGRI